MSLSPSKEMGFVFCREIAEVAVFGFRLDGV